MPITVDELQPDERAVYATLSEGSQRVYLDLSAPVRHLVGRWAPTDACTTAQQAAGACTPDPRVSAQVGIRTPIDIDLLPADTKFRDRVLPYRLKGARRGHLLLSPGGPSGLIGALLSALQPPQDYSHMGVIVDDDGFSGTLVRHCTTSEEWLNSQLFTTGTVFDHTPLAIDIPEHGFRSDAVKFLWPGTITQSVEIAFKSAKASIYRRDVYQLGDDGDYVMADDETGTPQRVLKQKFATVDAPNGNDDNRSTGKSFLIEALSFDPAFVSANKQARVAAHVAEALIVQPCALRETARVREALGRVADAALTLRGHYRFFAYSDGRVGERDDGPPTLETLSAPRCVDGEMVTTPVTSTRGMVCSTFVWQAVQLANLQDGGPRIVLDGRPVRSEPGHDVADLCEHLTDIRNGLLRNRTGIQDTADPQDGLYFYDEASRHEAAVALQERLIAKVMDNVGSFIDDVAGPPLIGGLVGGAAGAVISELIASNPVVLAILLGASTAYVDTQIQILRDTARHLSNQMGATFQSDQSDQDNDSDDWQSNPGTGNTVSPDDTIHQWASPYFESNDEVVGLYGSSQRVEVLSPSLAEEPIELSTWEISTDSTHAQVRVYFSGAGGSKTFVAGARVHIGCVEMVTQQLGDMTQPQLCGPVPIGQYYARAGWHDDNQGFQWMGRRQLVTVPGPQIDLEVFPPKQTRRSVRIHGKSDLLNRHATDEIPVVGSDPWERSDVPFDSGCFPMGLDLAKVDAGDDPEFATWLKDNYPTELDGRAQKTYVWEERMEDWGVARVTLVCELLTTGQIVVTATGSTKASDENESESQHGNPQPPITIEPKKHNTDPSHPFSIMVERVGPGFPPVRATVHIEFDNNQQGG